MAGRVYILSKEETATHTGEVEFEGAAHIADGTANCEERRVSVGAVRNLEDGNLGRVELAIDRIEHEEANSK